MRTKLIVTCLLAALLVGAIATAGLCDRLILTPTGSTLAPGQLKAEAVFDASEDANHGWLSLGMQRVELEYHRFQPARGNTENIFSLEASILPETTLTPAIGIGVRDITEETVEGRGYYAAISKTLPTPTLGLIKDVKLSGGVGVGSFDGPFFGAQAKLPLGFSASAEYDSEHVNYGLGWSPIADLKVKAYSLNGDLFIGASFTPTF